MKQQRRIFLKVLAAGPLVGCGAGSQNGLPDYEGQAGTDMTFGGTGSVPVGGNAPGGHAPGGNAAGGSEVTAAGSSSSGNTGNTGGSFFTNAGSSQGGTFGSGGAPSNAGSTSVAGSSSAAGAAGMQGAAGTGTTNFGLVYVGNVKDIALGSFQIVGGLFFMGRDANGIYAMSMQCTHKFCALVISGAILDCPCHHSHFDRDGKVLMGPATTPLPHFAVTIDGAGGITVDRYAVVPASTRTKV